MFGSSNKNKKPNENSGKPLGGYDEFEEPVDVNFKEINKLLNTDINDDNIVLTDADLEDPELLSQLSQIENGENLTKPEQPKKQVTNTNTTTTYTTVKTQQTITKPSKPQKTEDDELRDLMNDDDNNDDIIDHTLIQKLEERLIIYKKLAVVAKQQDNKTEALQYMKGAKAISEALENLKEGLPIESSALPPHISMAQLQQLQQNTLQQQQQQVTTQTPPRVQTPTTQTTPNIRSPTQLVSPKTQILSRETIEAEERIQTWDLIEEDFRRKHLKLTSEAVRLRDIDKVTAIHLLKESKGVHAIIDQILINRDAGLPPPSFHFEEKVNTTEISFPDIKENEFVIKLSNGQDLNKALTTDFTIYGELPYPSPEQPTKFQTSTVALAESSTFSYVTKVQIERKKTLQRCLEKKKITLVFYSSRMFFMKSVVGKCEIKLSDLLNKCEINEKVPILKEGSKKETGSFLNINIKMRTPLLGKELKVVKEKVLVLDTPITNTQKLSNITTTSTTTTTNNNNNNNNTTIASTNTLSTSTSKPETEPTSVSTSVSTTTTTTTTPAVETSTTTKMASTELSSSSSSSKATVTAEKTTTTTTTKSEGSKADDGESLEEMVEDLDRVVSNNVLESMQETINQQIATQGAKTDLLDRKQAVDIKLMILETNVSNGILSFENYLKQLEFAMAEDKKLALLLSSKGRKDLAVKIMHRIKVMQKELDECNQSEE
ncbi:hypothetical protein RB653_001435 [Dictyostelium firmibasis]|uniref:DM14 domain-containing protein n=1 Tax=Dictyostelium firmibasis TaxID=79012 RepID=A0AAN7UGP6_9MYCE